MSREQSRWSLGCRRVSAVGDLHEAGRRVTLIETGEVATNMQPDDSDQSSMLDPSDIAAAIPFAVTRPEHGCIKDGQLTPRGKGN